MSVFNDVYNKHDNFLPVNLYNWTIEFVLDGDAYEVMNNVTYSLNETNSTYKDMSWTDQANILSFMCKKCNLPKKKISEVNTYCRGMQASFNGGITIDSSLSLSFDDNSSRIVTKILNRLSSLYSNTNHISSNIGKERGDTNISLIDKVSLGNVWGNMVGGSGSGRDKNGHSGPSSNFNDYELNEEVIKNGYIDSSGNSKINNNNRDLTIIVKIYDNKLGYVNPIDYNTEGTLVESGQCLPLKTFIFNKCFINSLKFGDGFSYESEENLSIDCEIMYNWYNTEEEMAKISKFRNEKIANYKSGNSNTKDYSSYEERVSNTSKGMEESKKMEGYGKVQHYR